MKWKREGKRISRMEWKWCDGKRKGKKSWITIFWSPFRTSSHFSLSLKHLFLERKFLQLHFLFSFTLSLSPSSFPKTPHLFALIPSITGHEFLLESESLSQISFLQVFLSPRESHFRSLLLSVSLTFNHTFYIQVLSTLFQSQGESTKKGWNCRRQRAKGELYHDSIRCSERLVQFFPSWKWVRCLKTFWLTWF